MGTMFPTMTFMPVQAYEGGNGDLVLLQEWPAIDGERYVRIMVNMKDAEALSLAIMAVVQRAHLR